MRLSIAQHDGLWLDELHTAWTTGNGWSTLWERAFAGNQSGWYFGLVWIVRGVLGDSVLALRAVSIAADTLLILVTAHLTWSWTRSTVGTCLAAWLIATDSQFVFYGTEARTYALVQLVSVIQVLTFWSWLSRFRSTEALLGTNRPIRWRGSGLLLSVVTAMLFALHSTSVWLPLAEVIFFMGCWFVNRFQVATNLDWQGAWKSAILIALLTALFCVPALMEANSIFGRRNNWLPVSSGAMLLKEFRWPILLWLVLPMILVAIVGAFEGTMATQWRGTQFSQRNFGRTLFVLMWALVPIGSVWLLDHWQIAPLALSRYTLVGSAALPIFCGLCASTPRNGFGRWAVAGTLIGSSLFHSPLIHALGQHPMSVQLRFEDWHSPIAEINNRADKQTHPVILFANLIEDVQAFERTDGAFQEYLLFPIQGLDRVETTHRKIMSAPTLTRPHFRHRDIQLMQEQGGGWLIIRADADTANLLQEITDELRDWPTRPEQSSQALERDADKQPFRAFVPQIRFAQFPNSNVHLVSVDYPENSAETSQSNQ